MDLSKVLFHKGESWQALIPEADDSHPFGMDPEVVLTDLLVSFLFFGPTLMSTTIHLITQQSASSRFFGPDGHDDT